MRKIAPLLLVGFLLASKQATADDPAAKLHGVWKIVSLKAQIVGENIAPIQSLGPNPRGYLIFLPEGRMISLIVSTDRRPPTNDAESAALLRTMVSYSGKYTVDAEKFVTTPDVSWNEIYTGHEQVRYYRLDGNRLFTRTAEEPSALFPGKRIVATTEWVREE